MADPELRIVHLDEFLAVVEKPAGLVVHPAPSHTGPTLVDELGEILGGGGDPERPGIVHRLDKGTSGLLVVARDDETHAALQEAVRRRDVERVYLALAGRRLASRTGTIDAPIGRHPSSDWKWAVVAEGKPSITHYEVLEAFRAACLVEVHLETGRTHQIRVHFSALRHPCVGDLTYGADPRLAERLGLERQWLHAVRLGFTHPGSDTWVEFESAYPPDLATALERIAA